MDEKDEKDELPQLTDKQYNFVMGISKGLSKSEAYRQAYNAKKMKPETVHCKASIEASKGNVRQWLELAKREAINKLTDETGYTLSAHIEELNSIIEAAKASGSYGPALNGVIAKGKACNHYTEHKQINVSNSTDLTLLAKIEALLGPDFKDQAAKRLCHELEEHHTEH